MAQPEKKFRAGAVSATIWKNEAKGKDGEIRSYSTITLQRGYKDKEDVWQNTNSMRMNDLPKAILVMKKAYEYIVLSQDNTEKENSQDNTPEEEVIQ